MAGFMKKDEAALRWDEAKKRLRLEGRIVLDRIMNEVLDEAARDFTEGLANGQLMDLPDSREELQRYFTRAASKVLTGKEARHALAGKK